MSFDDFEADVKAHASRKGPQCTVGRMLAALPPADAAKVTDALANRAYTTPAIRAVLLKRLDAALVPAVSAIGNHRRGNCACPA